nr:zinc finger and SCAN domain-containing protein 2-like [Leptinotarsa decemlineata]
MESVIREGALRLLTTESSCDVILSCQGHRMMAHKLILSMASPVFRNLLNEAPSDPTVIIFPDVSSNTMSLVLDYIYTGNVVVYSNTIQDFISLAALLRIQLDIGLSQMLPEKDNLIQQNDQKFVKKNGELGSQSDVEFYSKRNQRKLPKLMPLHRFRIQEKQAIQRKMCNYVLPSPWCPRLNGLYGDPRNTEFSHGENRISSPIHHETPENDSNNNIQMKTSSDHYKTTSVSPSFQNLRNPSSSKGYNTELYAIRNVHNGSTCTVSRSPDNSSTTIMESCRPLNLGTKLKKVENIVDLNTISPEVLSQSLKPPNLEVVGTRKKPEIVNNLNEAKQNPIQADIALSKSVTLIDFEGAKEKIRLPSKDIGSDHSCSIDGEEDMDGRLTNKRRPKEKLYKCEDCEKSFSQLRNYKYHRSVHEGTKEFAAKCSECGKTFNDKGYLSSHMKIHRDKKEYACPHCPKRFNQRVAYNMHLRIHTGLKPHECSTCGKSFSRKMLLKQHQRVHTGERPYTCPECGKSFADRSNMSLHARLHTGVKPYACTLCPKSFTKKHHLKTHMNFHTGLKPYTCQKCGLAFSQSSNMRTHYKKCLLKDVHSGSSGGQETEDAINDLESS